MIQSITHNIYSIPVPLPDNPLKNLNVYVIKGERNLIIDTGFRRKECYDALMLGLSELEIDMSITDIFLTHLHSDHTGLAPDIASETSHLYIGEFDRTRLPGVPGYITREVNDQRYLKEGFPNDLLIKLHETNPVYKLAPAPCNRYEAVKDQQIFEYGGYHLKAIWTPGHTPGHMILFDEANQIAFLGDHVLFDITPNIMQWIGMENSLGCYLQSLKKVSQLPVKYALPAHRTVHKEFEARCEEIIAHHHKRIEEVYEILNQHSPMTAWEITPFMTWSIRSKSWEDFPLNQKWFAVGEAMAHLDYLISINKVEKTTINGIHYYSSL